MVPPDFNRIWQEFEQRQENKFELREKFCDCDADHSDWAQRLFYPAPSGLLSWRLVILGLFGLNIHVLHLRMCMAFL